MKSYHRETWGTSTWKNGRQVGAAPGLTPENLLGRSMTVSESRMWRRHGIVRVSIAA